MAITVISYAPGGHSYFHTPPAASCHPLYLRGGTVSLPSKAERLAVERLANSPSKKRGCSVGAGAYDTNLTVTGAYDHFAGSVICANIYIIA